MSFPSKLMNASYMKWGADLKKDKDKDEDDDEEEEANSIDELEVNSSQLTSILLMEFASSSSSSSSSSFIKSEPHFIYDAFINFWGEDIGRKFVSHLHSAFLQAQVKTFISQESLPKELELEEHMRAIGGTKIAIIVFSKTYTESACCLLELEKIIECLETFGQIVLPVFYENEPLYVRDEKNDFGKAMEETAHKSYSGEQREQVLSRWRRALNKAAGITGLNVREFRHDAQLVAVTVRRVQSLLGYQDLSVIPFPVELEPHVEKISKPRKELKELARNIVVYRGGLPVALKFLGSFLCVRTMEKWDCVFSNLKLIPTGILLDACIVKERETMSQRYKLKGTTLEMHSLLRDMGRDIIRKRWPKQQRKRSRLWFQDDVKDVVLTKNIERTFLI
ncbi:TMV resistance protein N-like isoform X3 [Vigna unguiculata]|uniref:TMV resistance protein N-like isoform X3 n=1 Tax=Vigna unguiculata TaxID=3917 RepID=UPI001015F3B7|nr:TMV resistance protein N-like isoform X3 [Vigna unguiculata]